MVCDFFMVLHHLMNSVDAWEEEAGGDLKDKRLETSLRASWLKLEKYYKLVDETPIYYAAIILNPTLKIQYFHQIWTSETQVEWIQPTIAKVREIWTTQFKQRNAAPEPQDNDEDTPFSRVAAAKRLKLSSRPSEVIDQFEAYISSDPLTYDKAAHNNQEFDVIRYWIDRQITWPELSKFALDTFAIPLMADDNERSFSAARDMVTYRRTRLQPDIIEACQCLKSWMKLLPRIHDDENIDEPFDELEEDLILLDR